ncbi:MaoC/PaaZ C-terminal domain-containing protein [Nonomuraea sp. NPDC003707]
MERTKEGPFGGTIAHGCLSLSPLPSFMFEMVEGAASSMGVNYGLNKVRFPRPVPLGARSRAVGKLTDVKGSPAGQLPRNVARLTKRPTLGSCCHHG